MRADQFITEQILLEYSREITLRNPTFRKKLVDKFAKEAGQTFRHHIFNDMRILNSIEKEYFSPTRNALLVQSKLDQLRILDYNTYFNNTAYRSFKVPSVWAASQSTDVIDYDLAANTVAAEIEDKAESVPQYIPWIMREYIRQGNDGIRRMEDISDAVANLVLYEQNKRRRGFPQGAKDITQLTAEQLRAAVRRYNPDDPEGIAQNMGDYEVVYGELDVTQDPKTDTPVVEIVSDVVVIHPRDKAASLYFGRVLGGLSKWCTAYIPPRTNMFDYYNGKGPLYIIIPRQPGYEGEKYQIHVADNQFMDEGDDPVSIHTLLDERFPEIKDEILALEPDLQHDARFADPEIIENIWKTIGQVATDMAYDIVNEWESTDDYYYEYIADFVDAHPKYKTEDGDIDWDKVNDTEELSYSNYNDDAAKLINEVRYIAELDYRQIIDLYRRIEAADDDSMEADIRSMEKAFARALSLENRRSRRDSSSSMIDIADNITRNIDISLVKATDVAASSEPAPSQSSAVRNRSAWHKIAQHGNYIVMSKI